MSVMTDSYPWFVDPYLWISVAIIAAWGGLLVGFVYGFVTADSAKERAVPSGLIVAWILLTTWTVIHFLLQEMARPPYP
jgi:membrane associated rhomboid family serine protease